jgi:hypothetical protein
MQSFTSGRETAMTRRQTYGLICAIVAMAPAGRGQTTDALISGGVYDAEAGTGIDGALVTCRRQGTNDKTWVLSSAGGNYTLQHLPPGTYWVRAEVAGYQAAETYELELFVAGRVDLDIPLRQLSDTYGTSVYSNAFVPSKDSIVHTYTADFATTNAELMSVLLGRSGTLRSTLSYVMSGSGSVPKSVISARLARRQGSRAHDPTFLRRILSDTA